jgi:subtilase family serine protease
LRKRLLRIGVGTSLAAFLYFSPLAEAQTVDETKLVRLGGNTRGEANAVNDRGRVDDSFALNHLLLQLKRSPEQEAAAQAFVEDLQDPQSANYHKFISTEEFGERFGAAAQDLHAVTNWLKSQGFTVNGMHPNGMIVDFSGTAGQVREAFHTEIHKLDVDGASHIANMSDPQIPEALAPVVEGVVSLHDFMPRPMVKARPKYTYTASGVTLEAVVPGDLQTIYNFNAAYAKNLTGLGQTIVVLEDSDMYSTADFTTFRSVFGLTKAYPSGSLAQVHPGGTVGGCLDPGANADDVETELDAEWASASAPNAAIVVASCADTRTNFGGFIALQNLISVKPYPSIVSISYGESESENGAASNAYINALYQNAAAVGVSVFVSAGDEGAASSDGGYASASHGVTVSAFASTPNNTAVGGTDFADAYDRTVSSYWGSTNGSNYASALKYIPEIPWNGSCASVLVAAVYGYSSTYGPNGFCASTTAKSQGWLEVVAGSGGASNCATGTPTQVGVASGSCQGYAKPKWQSVTGNPSDKVRDIPDVSMFASNGVWGHYYVFCYSDPARGRDGVPCTGAPSGWAGAGGTSFASPVMAGIQALINQHIGSAQGNVAPALYGLAGGCYTGSTSCPFNDVTLGDMDVNCNVGSADCYGTAATGRGSSSTSGGVLSTTSSAYKLAYGTTTGWDFATGLGSVNVYSLISAWPAAKP